MGGKSNHTSHPFPILHPTTPHAFPLARISSGKISAGYSHGTVNHVAPKMAVNRKTKNVAANKTSHVSLPRPLGNEYGNIDKKRQRGDGEERLRTGLGRGTDRGVLADAREAADEEGADAHAGGAPVEGPAAPDAVEGEDADEGGELGCSVSGWRGEQGMTDHVGDVVETGHP